VSLPTPFEMVVGGRTVRVSYRRPPGATAGWVVRVNGVDFGTAERLKQNDWVVTAYGVKYRGRALQPAALDAVKYELPRRNEWQV
jgi:hypothetical protein